MKKTLTIGGARVEFEQNARTPFLYKHKFDSDYFGDMISIGAAFTEDGFNPIMAGAVDFSILTQVAWACAKTADRDTPGFDEWLDIVPEFNIFDHGTEIMNMALEAMNTKKK